MLPVVKSIAFHILLLISIESYSQKVKVSNIFYRTIDDKIEIFYDLPSSSDTADIRIFFRKKSAPKTRYQLRWVTGSVGIGKFSGKKLKAVWAYKKEPDHLFTGSGFYYEIIAKKYKPPTTD